MDITASERTITVSTMAQEGISSLMGLLIASSGCPHTVFLKPMARFHLPMASFEETKYRVVSMYALSRYFQLKNGREAGISFQGLFRRYEEMGRVNRAIVNRLRTAERRIAHSTLSSCWI